MDSIRDIEIRLRMLGITKGDILGRNSFAIKYKVGSNDAYETRIVGKDGKILSFGNKYKTLLTKHFAVVEYSVSHPERESDIRGIYTYNGKNVVDEVSELLSYKPGQHILIFSTSRLPLSSYTDYKTDQFEGYTSKILMFHCSSNEKAVAVNKEGKVIELPCKSNVITRSGNIVKHRKLRLYIPSYTEDCSDNTKYYLMYIENTIGAALPTEVRAYYSETITEDLNIIDDPDLFGKSWRA